MKFDPSLGKLWLIALGALLVSVGSAYASGGDSSGGTDILAKDHGVAWFLGNGSVKYCIEASDNFGATPAEIREAFSESARIWKDYFRDRAPEWFGEDMKPAQTYAYHPQCDGSEDLHIYAGKSNRKVRKAIREYDAPLGFAKRERYDPRMGWGKGYLWLARPADFPGQTLDWKKPYSLVGILLHELGHVMGCDHVDGTIMRSTLGSGVFWSEYDGTHTEDRRQRLTQIDGSRGLLSSSPFKTRVIGEIPSASNYPKPELTFERLTGRKPVGAIHATLEFTSSTGPANSLVTRLILADEKGEFRTDIAFTSGSESYLKFHVNIFKTYRIRVQGGENQEIFSEGGLNEGSSRIGTLKTAEGRILTLAIHSNMHSHFVDLRYVWGDAAFPLFVSTGLEATP